MTPDDAPQKLRCKRCDEPDCPTMAEWSTDEQHIEAAKVCALRKIGTFLENLTWEVQQIRMGL